MEKPIIKDLNRENWQDLIWGSEGPILIYFGAEWCPPCQTTIVELLQFAEDNPWINVYKINMDTQQDIAVIFEVSAMPTFYLLREKDRKALCSWRGESTYENIQHYVNSFLKGIPDDEEKNDEITKKMVEE